MEIRTIESCIDHDFSMPNRCKGMRNIYRCPQFRDKQGLDVLGEVFMSEASKVEEVKSLMLQRSRLTLRIEKMNVEYREFNKSLKVLRYEIDVINKRLAVLNGVG